MKTKSSYTFFNNKEVIGANINVSTFVKRDRKSSCPFSWKIALSGVVEDPFDNRSQDSNPPHQKKLFGNHHCFELYDFPTFLYHD